MNIKKIFDPNGDLKVTFARDAEDQIQYWLGDIPYDEAIKWAKDIDCPVFGTALEFPCRSVEFESTQEEEHEDWELYPGNEAGAYDHEDYQDDILDDEYDINQD